MYMRKTFSKKRIGKKTRRNKKIYRGGLIDFTGMSARDYDAPKNYILYGGIFEPNAGIVDEEANKRVSDLLENTVRNSASRAVMSTAAGILKAPTTPLSLVANDAEGLLNAAPTSLVWAAAASPFIAMSKVSGANNDFINARARTRIVDMLNSYANNSGNKISYPHLWKDVTPENKLKRLSGNLSGFADKEVINFDRDVWVKQNPLSENLTFRTTFGNLFSRGQNSNGQGMMPEQGMMPQPGMMPQQGMAPKSMFGNFFSRKGGKKNNSKKYKKRKTRR